jgi:hypothetical protein
VRQSNLLPRLAFLAACLFFAFLGGFVASHFQLFPHSFLAPALDQGVQVFSGEATKLHHQAPARHDFVGVMAYDQNGKALAKEAVPAGDGVILLTSFWPEYDWRPGIRLIDRTGKTLHHWDVDLQKIWPEFPYTDGAESFYGNENYIHGSYLFDNGDVLFNVEYMGLVRLDRNGNIVWKLDRHTHHSVTRDEDGNFWVCEMNWITDIQVALTRFFGLIPPFTEDCALKVSPEGKVLEEISILEIICKSEFRSLLWRAGPHVPTRTTDPLHMNDVEPLPRALAEQYPLFAAGDLVVSLYQLNLVMVFDAKSKQVKWSRITPLVHQHDPDFIGDGWISVFNNNADGTPNGIILGGSTQLDFQTNTGEMRQVYPRVPAPSPRKGGHQERQFYTPVGGKSQLLQNGHWLLTEAVGARVLEIDPEGHTVWEWAQQRHEDGKMVSEVLEGTWYPYSAEQVAGWSK